MEEAWEVSTGTEKRILTGSVTSMTAGTLAAMYRPISSGVFVVVLNPFLHEERRLARRRTSNNRVGKLIIRWIWLVCSYKFNKEFGFGVRHLVFGVWDRGDGVCVVFPKL